MTTHSNIETHYRPGAWVVVAGPRTWLLLGSDALEATVAACWDVVSQGGDVDGILDALVTHQGLRQLPGFAAAGLAGDEVRVVVRHPARAELVDAHGDLSTVAAPEGSTWTDQHCGQWTELRLRHAADGQGRQLPLSGGVLLADAVFLRQADAPVSSLPDPADRAVGTSEEGASPEQRSAPPPVSGTVDPVGQSEGRTLPPPDLGPRVDDYDHLFGATTDRVQVTPSLHDHEPTAVVAPDRDPVDEDAASRTPCHDAAPLPVAAPEPTSPVPGGPRGLIDEVPWQTPAAAAAPAPAPPDPVAAPPGGTPQPVAAPPPAVPPAAATEENTATVNRAALAAALPEPGPTVLAATCPAGHLSPAHAPLCRVCRTAMPPQQPVEAPRPPLGVLRLSTGDQVTLDRGVILGRAPQAPDAHAADQPHLLRLAGPELSRNHAEVVLDGWHVLVRDLGSSNGTTLTLPGASAELLRPHQAHALEPGCTVGLGDVLTFTFEVTG